MEQRGRSADTVSCQPLSASASLRESHSRSSTGRPQNVLSRRLPSLPPLTPRRCASQVGACQSDLPVSHTPDGPAAAQCRLLRHGGAAARLLGRPQARHRPIHQGAEGGVSAFQFHFLFGDGSLSTSLLNIKHLRMCVALHHQIETHQRQLAKVSLKQ